MAQDSTTDMKAGPINELQLNLLGKVLLAGVAAWLVGKATNLKFRGSLEEVTALSNAMVTTKLLQEELIRPGSTVATVSDVLRQKRDAAQEFERIIGLSWPM